MNRKSPFFILLFSLFFLIGHAQKEGNIWYFGAYAGLDFNSGSPVTLTNSAMKADRGCASISNSDGELLFYTNGVTIWNSSHQVMDNGTGLRGSPSATQSGIIVGKPGSDSLYYVFTVPDVFDTVIDTAYYSLVDVTLNGGLGMVISKNNFLYSPSVDKITAVYHENGEDVWVILHDRCSDAFCSFLVTSVGINPIPVISNVGHYYGTGTLSGYLKASPSGNSLACVITGGAILEIYDFDNSTGTVSNSITIGSVAYTLLFPYGVEFSPDERRLYFSGLDKVDGYNHFYQVDLTAGTEAAISESLIDITPYLKADHAGALQIGPDQKIYCSIRFSRYLSVINNPNELGYLCNFVKEGVYLGGKRCEQGLPTFNQSYFSASITYQNECLADTTFFELSTYTSVQSITWDFGDPASGSNNTSTEFYPGHVFSSFGVYTVSASIVLDDGTTKFYTVDVTIYDFPQVILGNDTVICENDQLLLDAGSGFVSYLWNTGEITQTVTVNSPGVYDVAASTEHCTSYDTIQVSVQASAFSDAGSDEAICRFESFDFSTSGSLPSVTNEDSIRWIGGAGLYSDPKTLFPIYTPDAAELGAITLSLVAYNASPCSNDTSSMTLTVNSVPAAGFTMSPVTSICVNEEITFTNSDNAGITDWIWDFGDGSALASGDIVTHTYANSGTYTVTLEVSNVNNCTGIFSQSVVVNGLPLIDFSYLPVDSLCVNEDISFADNSSVDVVSWGWDFGDGNISSLQNPNHNFLAAGNYQVKLRATNMNTCADSAISTLIINPLPDPDFTILPGETVCARQPVTVSGFDGAGTVIEQWLWDFGDGATGMGQSIAHSYAAAGDYTISLQVVNNHSCSSLKAKSVHINALPVSDFIISPNDTSCMSEQVNFAASNFSGDITQWNWELGDGNSANGQNVTHVYNSPVSQDYSILSIYQNAFGCVDTTIHQRRVEMVSIDFNMVDNPTCMNTSVNFGSTGDRFAFTPYQWDFGDGSSDVGLDGSHTYTVADTVDVVLNVCSEQAIHQLIINPTSQVTAGNDTMTCQDVYFDLSRLETPPTASNYDSIRWFTDGIGHFNDPTLVTPTYFPDPSEGLTENDTLTMTMVGYGLAPCGNDTSTMQLIVIPGASAHAGSDESTCFGVPFDFHSSIDSSFAMHHATLYWETSGTGHFVDPNESRPIYVPGPNEIGEVTLTMVAANIINCDSIDEMILTIRPTYEIPVDITLCHYDSIFAQGVWQYSTGTYFDTLQTYNYGCDSVIVTNLTIRPKIDHDVTLSRPSPLCQDESITFTPTGTAQIIDRLWIFGDGATSTLLSPTHTYSTPGNYQLIYYYTDQNGCSDSITLPIDVNSLPEVDFTMSVLSSCMDTPIDFMGSSSSNITTWDWDFGDGQTSTGQNISHTYSTWGTMQVLLTVTDQNGCSETALHTLNISESPIADFTYTVDSCHTIHFLDASTAPSGFYIVTYEWDMGDGNTIHDDPEFNYSYAEGGLYSVTLTVTAENSDYFSCSNTITLPVIVPNTPTIYYTFDPDTTCLGETTYFYGASGTEITSWYWNFDDGLDSTGQYTGHIYDNPGSYDVTLYITDTNLCQNSLTKTVIINDIPDVTMQIFSTPNCANSTISFMGDSPQGIASWMWNFGDGGISENQNPDHIFTDAGTYTITLTATDSAGCSGTTTGTVQIVPGPTADYSYSMSGCNLFSFTDLSTAPAGFEIVGWEWTFGDGSTSVFSDPTHVYATGGFYDVKLVVTSEGVTPNHQCTDSITQTILAPDGPSANFFWNPNPAQQDESISFVGTSGSNITSWAWDFDDGFTATGQNTSHTFDNPGDYDVSLTVTDNNGCVFEQIITVPVAGLPPVEFSWAAACEDTPVQFTVDETITDVGAVDTYYWDFGDGLNSTDQNPLHAYVTSGLYNATLTITDTLGYSNSITHEIDVKPNPISVFAIETPNCENTPTQFTDYSVALSGFITTWEWDFGDGSPVVTINQPDDPDVSHTYTGTGTFSPTLTVTSSDGCTHTSIETLSITPAPIAQIDVTQGCTSGPVTFHDVSNLNGSGDIINREWNFGDPASGASNTSDLVNPTHIFSSAGDYDISLIIESSSGCSDTATVTITVTEAPEVDFTFTPACMGEEVSFTITDLTDLDTFFWDFGDGNISVQSEPTNQYDTPGDFEVTLVVQTIDGCSATQTHTVTVNPLPAASFEYSQPTCQGDTINFLNLSNSPNGAIVKWEWDFGDGTTLTLLAPNSGNTSHVYTNDQPYNVTLTVTDSDSCQNFVTREVISVASPVAEFNWEDACYGMPTNFFDLTNSTEDIASWYWDFGDPLSGTNNTSTIMNPSHIFTDPADYTVTLIVTNTQGCDDTITHDLTVAEAPDVSINITQDTICANTPVSFEGSSTSEISTWFWDFGDGGSAIAQNADYVYTTPGTYTVTLTVTGLDGCEAMASEEITVKDVPLANFIYQNACLGDSTYFTDESYSQLGYIASWDWDLGDGTTSTEQNPTHLYAINDDYQVTLIVMDNYGCSDTIQQWVKVRTRPIANIDSFVQVCDPIGQVYFFDGSEPGADGSPIQTWEWNLNEGYYSSEIDPEYIYDKTDTCYQVTLTVTDDNGCYSIDTVEVCVFGTLEVDITADQVCLTQPTTFYAHYLPESDSVASYTWDFHDGTPQITDYRDSIQHTFANPGIYNVELVAVDTNGCSAYASIEIQVDSLPTPRFSYEAGACEVPMQFTDESLTGGNFIEFYYWDFGDAGNTTEPNTSTEENPTHLYLPNDSTYTVKLIVTNFNGCTDSITQEVTTQACLLADFYPPELPLCSNNEICFADSSSFITQNGNITTWDWDFGDGQTMTYDTYIPDVCHSYEGYDGATYEVTLSLTGQIGTQVYTNSITKAITISSTPEAMILLNNNCFNDTTYLMDGSDAHGIAITTWSWDLDTINAGTITSAEKNPKHKYLNFGSYVTKMIVTNEAGCMDSTTREVTVYDLPVAAFSIADTCQGYYTYFYDQSIESGASIANWTWIFGDTLYPLGDTARVPEPKHIYQDLGEYTATLMIEDQNTCKDTITRTFIVNPVPTALFTLTENWEEKQGQVKLDNMSVGTTELIYDWFFDDGDTSQQVNPIHQYLYDSDPIYNLMLIATNNFGCPDTLIYPYELLFTGLYVPNAFSPSLEDPTFNTFKPVGINLSEYKLEVFSSWGNIVFTSTQLVNGEVAQGWDGTFEGEDLPTGVYIWRITARFSDGSYWRGSDNGDGNLETNGTVTLIR